MSGDDLINSPAMKAVVIKMVDPLRGRSVAFCRIAFLRLLSLHFTALRQAHQLSEDQLVAEIQQFIDCVAANALEAKDGNYIDDSLRH